MLWLPALWVRTERRAGLRPPRVEWHGEEGLLAGVDATLPIGSIDADVGAAVQTSGPAEARLTLAGSSAAGSVTARSDGALTDGALASSGAVARWDVATSREVRLRREATIEALADRPRPLDALALASGGALAASSGLVLRQTSRAGGVRLAGAVPSLRATAGPLILFGRALLDARLLADRRIPTETLRASVAPRLLVGFPASILRVRAATVLEATGERGPLVGEDGAARIATAAAGSLSLPLERRWRSVVHEIAPSVTVSHTVVPVRRGRTVAPLDDLDAVVEGTHAEASLASLFASRSGEELFFAEMGGLLDPAGQTAFARARLPSGPLSLDGTASLDIERRRWSWVAGAAIEVGPARFGLDHALLSADRSLLAVRRPALGSIDAVIRPVTGAEVAGADLEIALGPRWRARGRGAFDLSSERLAGIDGSVLWSSSCGCLSLGLSAAFFRGRELPDVRALVALDDSLGR